VQCTWDLLLEKSSGKLRGNPLKFWYSNLEEVSTNGDYEVTFHLKRPPPSFLMFLADGFAVIYRCHMTASLMRQHPIGTGPFKFVEFKPNEHIKLTRNPDYWKPGLPYLDGVESTIIKNMSTATLAFVSGKLDMTFPYSLRSKPRGSISAFRMAGNGVRREKAALSSGCKAHPAIRSSRKQSEQSWR